MKDFKPYLIFNGNCREAMTFYGTCFGAEPEVSLFSQGPGEIPKEAGDRVMHAYLTMGSAVLMASDNMPGMSFQQGDNFLVCVNCESRPEIETLFAALGENGKVLMPLQDTFWGAYFGMLTDRFGVQWMFSLEHPKQGS